MKTYLIIVAAIMSCGIASKASREPKGFESSILIERLVNIQSGTGQSSGLDLMRKEITTAFEALGLTLSVHETPEGRKVLSFEMAGSQPDTLILAHIDTVFTEASPATPYRVEGERMYGGGIIDMKAGIVMILELLQGLKKDPSRLAHIRVVFNDEEEVGSPTTRTLLRQLAEGMKSILVFEPGLPGGAVVTSTSGVRWLNLKIHGKAAHAGLEHKLGYNACVELGHKIVNMARLTNYKKNLTINTGVIQGGIKSNVVCEDASAEIDVRFVNVADWNAAYAKIQEITKHSYARNPNIIFKPIFELKITAELPTLPEPKTAALFQILSQSARQISQKVVGSHVGYATDASHLANLGANILVGLGPYGGGMHTKDEFMLTSSYTNRLNLNRQLLRNLIP